MPSMLRVILLTLAVLAPLAASAQQIQMISAFTQPGGQAIPADTWQQDDTPYMTWVATGAPSFSGFSFAVDALPDCGIDTIVANTSLAPLADGQHAFQVRAIDAIGNCGLPATFVLRVDQTADAIASLEAFSANGGAAIFDGTWQTDRDPFMSWTTSAGAAPSAGFSFAVDLPADCSPDAGMASVQLGVLADGPHLFQVRALDAAGNCGTPATFTLAVDGTGDAVVSLDAFTDNGGAAIAAGTWQQDNTPFFAWAAAASTAPIAGYSYAIDAPADCNVDTGAASLQLGALGDGVHPFQVRVLDVAGNCGEPSSFTLSIDATGDAIATLGAFTAAGGGAISEGTWQQDRDPYFAWAAAPSTAPIDGYSYAIDASPDCAIDTADASVQLGVLGDGAHFFRIRPRDSAGNCGTVSTFELRVDATGDPITSLTAFTAPGGAPISSGVPQPDTDPFLVWSVGAGAAPVSGWSFAVDVPADCTFDTGAPSVQLGVLAGGLHPFQVRALDVAGNCGPVESFELAVQAAGQPIPALDPRGFVLLAIALCVSRAVASRRS